ncbi:ribonuclease R [Clostridia bacterium]|nr:ribonuclease R [Clostridia bacterium]
MGAYRYFTAYELACNLGITNIGEQCALDKALHHLISKGKIEQVFWGKFRLRRYDRFTGVVDGSIPGCPKLVNGSYRQPVHILPDKLRGASHGDTVLVSICRTKPYCLEAEVLRIFRFAQRILVGTLEILEQRAYCVPLNQQLFCDIEVPLKYIKGAKNGDCVAVRFYYRKQSNARRIYGRVVRILGDPALPCTEKKAKRVYGRVVRVLGEAGLPSVKKLAHSYICGFPAQFTPEEEEAAAAIDFTITPEETGKRLDMRGVMTFTIDPADCKDIDDALSFRALENGNLEVGIHIADVSHFLKSGSILDQQAYGRTTSVYLADHAIPMLPDTFMRGCSLFPEKDRLAFSVIFTLDSDAKVLYYKIAKTVICSQRQFDYEEAQKLIDEPEDERFSTAMNALFVLSQKLRKRRFANGAISFNDRSEFRFEFDAMGKVLDVKPYKRAATMSLIEEFMLLANRTIAETAAKKQIPFVYRSHGSPKIATFKEMCRVAANYGYTLHETRDREGRSNRAISRNIAGFLSQMKTPQEESLFTYLAIRSMMQGKYSHVPRRHFALAFDHYAQFTSPIRRYVDIVVHRIMAQELSDDTTDPTGIFDYEEACRHFNRRREQAKAMERNSDQQKCAEFLRPKIGRSFDGIIVYVTSTQIEVELSESGIRGTVPLRSLKDDRYRLNYNTYKIIGEKSHKCYRICDPLRLRLVYVDVDKGIVEFNIQTE